MIEHRAKISAPISSVPDFQKLLQQSREMAQTGRSDDALKVLSQAEKLIRKNTSLTDYDRDLQLSKIHINRGITLKNMKLLEKSAKSYEDAMKILSKYPDRASREIFSAELNLAILRTRLKDRKKALSGFSRAEKIAEGITDSDQKELLLKVLTNKAQLHIEFHEIDDAREILGNLTSEISSLDMESDRERVARFSAKLGLLIVHCAEREDDLKLIREHCQQAIKFFNDAIRIYNRLGLTGDAMKQTINKVEALIIMGRHQEARKILDHIYAEAVNKSDFNLLGSACIKYIKLAAQNEDREEQEKWLYNALDFTKDMTVEAREDYLERLESNLRWTGGENLIAQVQKQRERESFN